MPALLTDTSIKPRPAPLPAVALASAQNSPRRAAIPEMESNSLQNAAPGEVSASEETGGRKRGLFGPDGFSFKTLLDIVNPLQQLPVVGTIYRHLTGETIEPGARLAGGALYGGPIGFVVSLVNSIIEDKTGKDIGDHALAFAGIDLGPATPAQDGSTALAQKAPAGDTAYQPQKAALVSSGVAAEDLPPLLQAQAEANDAPSFKLAGRLGGDPANLPDFGAPGGLLEFSRSAFGEQNRANAKAQADYAAKDSAPIMMPPSARPAQPVSASVAQADMASPVSPGQSAQVADDRKWFPAFPTNGGAPTRGVGAQPVTQQTVQQKFGVTRGANYGPAAGQQADWAERANAAYQKYIDMKKTEQGSNSIDQRF